MQIKQIVDNLIANAIDAMAAGSPKRLSVATRVQSNYVELAINDTGEGIDADDINKLFSPDFTTKPVGKGTGLGLSICYGIINKMGGEISVDSILGEGTTFHIHFPLSRPSRMEAESPDLTTDA